MSILKIKYYLDCEYNGEGACWYLTSGDINHIKVGDVLSVTSSENWSNASLSVSIKEVNDNSFKISQTEISGITEDVIKAVFVKEYSLKDPTSLQWDISDLDYDGGSGRNQKGLLFRQRITSKRKVNCSWAPMMPSELSELLQSMDGVFFELVYPDAYTGQMREGTFYVESRSVPLYTWSDEKNMYLWSNLSTSFTER